VLLYAHDPRDPAKQQAAVTLLQSLTDGALLWQVACEYLSASAKLEPLGYSRASAWHDIRDLRRVWTCILPSCDVLDRAERASTYRPDAPVRLRADLFPHRGETRSIKVIGLGESHKHGVGPGRTSTK
jgi:hypothetical protein